MTESALRLILLYFVVPVWLAAGVADWLCHRASRIERTTGTKESVLHSLMLAEVGLPLLAALFLQINALLIAAMLVLFVAHEFTALWDVSCSTYSDREVTPIEQHVHSFLELMPLLALVCVIALHWGQFLALFGAGPDTARFDIAWKQPPLAPAWLAGALAAIAVFGVAPYVEELVRCIRASGTRRA